MNSEDLDILRDKFAQAALTGFISSFANMAQSPQEIDLLIGLSYKVADRAIEFKNKHYPSSDKTGLDHKEAADLQDRLA